MANNMQGMDTEEARTVANQMGEHAGMVGGVCARLLARVTATSWVGPDKDSIADDIGNSFIPNANAACREIEQQASYLIAKADEQDSVSS